MRKFELMSADLTAFQGAWGLRRRASWRVVVAVAFGVVSPRAQEYFQSGLPVSFQGQRRGSQSSTGSPHYDFSTLQNNLPYVPPSSVISRGDTSFRYGNLSGSLYAGLSTRYTDNVFLVDTGRESDVVIAPRMGVSLNYAPSKASQIGLDLGLGYDFYINNPELNFLNAGLSPSSVLNYRVIVGNVMIVVYDRFIAPSDNRTRAEVVASQEPGATALVNSQIIDNTLGTTASWAINEELVLLGGYGYGITRNYSGNFSSQDRDTHTLSSSLEKRFGPVWSTGVYGRMSSSDFLEEVQNDATSWSTGPILSFRPFKNIQCSASVGYTVSEFDVGTSPTSIQDDSSFTGLTYEATVNHQFSPRMQHYLSFSQSADLGFGSNYTENQEIAYGIVAPELIRRMGLSGGISWLNYVQSAPVSGSSIQDSGDTLRLYVGADYPFSRRVTGLLGLGHNRRSSDIPSGNYNETTANVSISYRF